MIQSGDSSLNFSKVKPMQLAEIRSVLQKRPKAKFSMGLSPEAQAAMQQVAEESKIQQANKRGKRGSKGNVLFSDTVHVREDTGPSPALRRPSVSDIFEEPYVDYCYTGPLGDLLDGGVEDEPPPLSPRRSHGRRRSSVSKWLSERRGSLSASISEVELVQSANHAGPDNCDGKDVGD